MTIKSDGVPGKTCHLNDIAACCENMGMRVICVDAAESDFWSAASLPCAPALGGKARISLSVLQRARSHCLFLGKPGSGKSVTKQQVTRVFLAKSDVSQIKALYSGEEGDSLAEAIRQNCHIWYQLEPEEGGHDK